MEKCLCRKINKMVEEAATRSFEEKMEIKKPPVYCNTNENSVQLHEIYKDKVKRTLPDPDKPRKMEEMLRGIEHAKEVRSAIVLEAKLSEVGVKRRPSTLSHMNHDDSDSEGEVVELNGDSAADGTKQSNTDQSLPKKDINNNAPDGNKLHQKEMSSAIEVHRTLTSIVDRSGVVKDHTSQNDTIFLTDDGTPSEQSATDYSVANADNHDNSENMLQNRQTATSETANDSVQN